MYGSIQCPTSSAWVLCWLCQVSSIHFEPSTTSQKHWTLASEIAVRHKVLACSKSVTVESAQSRKCHYSLILMWEGSGHKTIWQWSGIGLVVFFLMKGWGLGTRLLWVQFTLSSHCILPSPPPPGIPWEPTWPQAHSCATGCNSGRSPGITDVSLVFPTCTYTLHAFKRQWSRPSCAGYFQPRSQAFIQ